MTHPALARIHSAGVLPVIRVPHPDLAVPLAQALCAGGLPLLEITLRDDTALESLRRVHAACPDMLLCAGTVRSPALVREAVEAGAQGVVAPGLRADVAAEAEACGVFYLPACVTGTEIEAGLDLGLRAFKFFPAGPLGGPEALKLLSGPYADVSFIPTGGITVDNLASYLTLPCVAACGGSFMAPSAWVQAQEWERISTVCRRCAQIAAQAGRGGIPS